MQEHVDYIVVVSEMDPVARGVVSRFGPLESVGESVDGARLRKLAEHVWVLRRPGLHIYDAHLDRLLPPSVRGLRPTLVFPSIHQSESGTPCFTVHPLGNPGASAEVGGRSRTLVPTDPRRMASTLRLLEEAGGTIGLEATFEATHHGPELDLPAFFVEIGFGGLPEPPQPALDQMARLLPRISVDPEDRVAVAVGGGHYAPHFTELVLERHWAVGHILSRHSIEGIDEGVARSAWDGTPGATGWLCARTADYADGPWAKIGPRAKDNEAPRRVNPAPPAD